MQQPYTKPKGIFWHHKELWREMLSSFVDSLFKVPYGTPIELPHASMWSKLVKIDFTSSLLMLSIAYPNGHTLKDTIEDMLQRVMIDGTPKGTQSEGHPTRNTLRATLSRKTLRGMQPKEHNWETLPEGQIFRDMLQGTRTKGHDQGTRLKGHNWGTRLTCSEDQCTKRTCP